MTEQEPVKVSASVASSPAEAFEVFTSGMGQWWDPRASQFGVRLEGVVIEPTVGGRWFERGPDGAENDWGRVLAWEPAHRVVLAWHLQPPDLAFDGDPDLSSEVEVRFIADAEGRTRVDLEHRHIERHGPGAAKLRTFLGSVAWPDALARFTRAAAGEELDPMVPRPEGAPRMVPLLAQLDVSLPALVERMEGITDDEYLWEPAPLAYTVRRQGDRWVPDSTETLDPAGTVRTIAWLCWHLGSGAALRSDWTTGGHSLTFDDLECPGTAAEGIAFLTGGMTRWRETLEQMTDDDLDVVGRSQFPWGLDPGVTILDIAYWTNRELIHHGAEIAYVRDLYGQLGTKNRVAAV